MLHFNILHMMIVIPGVVLGLTVHEFAHAAMAYFLGDKTAKSQGRLSLNPFSHIDPFGFFLLVVAGFGWAKPVLFNPRAFKHPQTDEIAVSLAGPFSNLLLAILLIIGIKLISLNPHFAFSNAGEALRLVFEVWSTVNVGLFVFNMLPIPPLDGSHIYSGYLYRKNPQLMMKLNQYGMYVLLAIILLQNFGNLNILPIGSMIKGIESTLFAIFGA